MGETREEGGHILDMFALTSSNVDKNFQKIFVQKIKIILARSRLTHTHICEQTRACIDVHTRGGKGQEREEKRIKMQSKSKILHKH